jgi:hypothetical protein
LATKVLQPSTSGEPVTQAPPAGIANFDQQQALLSPRGQVVPPQSSVVATTTPVLLLAPLVVDAPVVTPEVVDAPLVDAPVVDVPLVAPVVDVVAAVEPVATAVDVGAPPAPALPESKRPSAPPRPPQPKRERAMAPAAPTGIKINRDMIRASDAPSVAALSRGRERNARGAWSAPPHDGAMLALHPRAGAAKGALMPFRDDVSAVLASLGPEAERSVADAVADPGGAAAALEKKVIVLRAAPVLGEGAAGFGPDPEAPIWVHLTKGAREAIAAPLTGGEKSARRAASVAIESTETTCCDAPSCAAPRIYTAAWLVCEDGARLLVAEQHTVVPARGAATTAFAARLAAYVGVPLEGAPGPDGDAADGAIPAALGAIPAADLARFALRTEGDRAVLRDYAGVGPRATARRNTIVGALLMMVGFGAGAKLALGLGAGGASTGEAVALGATTALFLLAGYAFLGVARFSSRYVARSTALVAVGRDRLIVLPWVSRSGAVDARPEGRLGAAIPLGEVRSPTVAARGETRAIVLDTDHGAIDALGCESEKVAAFWAAALARVTDEARHPQASASARQRARSRAKE